MKKLIIYFFIVGTGLIISGTSFGQDREQAKNQKKEYWYFEDPQVCSGCHWDKFDRFSLSQHSKGFSGDFFQKQFYDLVLPSVSFDQEKLVNVADDCIACHSPSAFLSGDSEPQPTINPDNHWISGDANKQLTDRGIFCDFCHTMSGFENNTPFNHDYISDATDAVDTKYGDLEFPWSPHHETQTSEIYEALGICATCHNELNPYNVWVKQTHLEYEESVYPSKGIICQTCHMQPMGGKPAKMGIPRPYNSDHWFGGGFTEFVEGAARVEIQSEDIQILAGQELEFDILVQAVATGHKFPTGSTEERDVWLRVTLIDHEANELLHIPVNVNRNDPNDKYFITSNDVVAYPSHSSLSDPISRDALPEGDRIYHSVFLDSEGEFTFAQWLSVDIIDNRLNPLEERLEHYSITIPDNLKEEKVYLKAVLYYKRMPDSFADYLEIDRRPVIEVASDTRKISIE